MQLHEAGGATDIASFDIVCAVAVHVDQALVVHEGLPLHARYLRLLSGLRSRYFPNRGEFTASGPNPARSTILP